MRQFHFSFFLLAGVLFLITGNIQAQSSFQYDLNGNLTNITAAITGPPIITESPTNQEVFIGQDAGFGVQASGSEPMSYQWYDNGVLIRGATNSTLFLPNATLSEQGSYSVEICNSYECVTSTIPAMLVVRLTTAVGLVSTISCGQTVTDTTTSNGEVDQYNFSSTAGQPMIFTFWWGSCTPGTADIYNPSGQWVTNITSSCGGGVPLPLALPTSGTYTILVHASGYNATSSYQLSVQTPVGGCGSRSIVCGQTVTTNTSNVTEMDPFNYSATAGQPMIFTFWWGSCTPGTADIYNPSGQWVTNITSSCGGGVPLPLALPTSGTYTILVHASGYNATSSYQLSVQTPVGGGCNGSTLTCGQSVSGQISFASQMNSYEMVATAGEEVSLSDNGFSGMVVNIYNSTGSSIVSVGSSTSTNYTFASTGIYTLLVHSGGYNATGSYNISFTVSGGCDAVPVVSVSPTNLVLYSGEAAIFTANATGPFPLYYQWRFANAQLMGATNTYYSIASVVTNNAGNYVVVVSNPGGSVTSAPPAVLSVGTLQLGLKFSGNGLMLSWPTNATSFTLQMATNLTPPIVWSNVVITPTTANGQNMVSNSISGPRQFYRLSQ